MDEPLEGITDAIYRAAVWLDYARAYRDNAANETYRKYEMQNRAELIRQLQALGVTRT